MIPANRKRLEKLEASTKCATQDKPIIELKIIDAVDGKPAPGSRETYRWDYAAGGWQQGVLQ